MGISAKIAKICDKTDGISARIDRTCKETAAIFGKTTATCEQTVKRCGRTRGDFVRTGNNSSMMNVGEPTLDSSSRTGNRCGRIVTTSKAIGRISEEIDRICIRIGRTYEPTGSIKAQTGKGSVAGINNGWATVDSVQFATRQ
jgi:hypothetical protein